MPSAIAISSCLEGGDSFCLHLKEGISQRPDQEDRLWGHLREELYNNCSIKCHFILCTENYGVFGAIVSWVLIVFIN
jgi:hypothetical protein